MMERDDDRAGAEEQQRFEERVGTQVKHRLSRRVEADSHDHVT